jgi:hypothetical protein
MPEPQLHLLLVGRPKQLDMQDFEDIAGHVRRKAPDIEPFVIPDGIRLLDPAVAQRATSKPFLLFAPIPLEYFRPSGGKQYCGRVVPKLEQMEAFKRLNMPVPRWTVIRPGTKLDPKVWGDVVVVKPVLGSLSAGVELRMTADVAFRLPQSYPADHPGRRGPMMAQVFVDPGPEAARIRVLTLFGEPLYAEEIKIPATERPAVLTAEVLKDIPIVTTRSKVRYRSFVHDADVLGLARQVSRILPDVPLKACDFIREWKTGRLYVLELNPGGNTWHFSTRGGLRESVDGQKRQEQFNAFELAADLLIDRTRREARK